MTNHSPSGPAAPVLAPDSLVAEPLITTKPLSFWVRYRSNILGAVGVVTLLTVWEAVSRLGLVDPLFISSPSRVVMAGPRAFQDDNFLHHINVSGQEFGIGMALVIISGIPIGLLAGWYRVIWDLTDPLISAFFSTPVIALVPILVMTIGIGIGSKIAVVYLMAIWPVIINTTVGIHNIDSEMIRMARTFGAGDMRVFRTIALPASVPYIIVGLRNGIARGLVAVVVGELYAAQAGVGYYLNITGQLFQTDRYYFAVTFLAMVGVFAVLILNVIESRVSAWRVG